jgi:hypothetical protein
LNQDQKGPVCRWGRAQRAVGSAAIDRQQEPLFAAVDIGKAAVSIMKLPSGAFVYRLGHGPLKAERRVRFPYALPLEIKHLRKSASKVQVRSTHLNASDSLLLLWVSQQFHDVQLRLEETF